MSACPRPPRRLVDHGSTVWSRHGQPPDGIVGSYTERRPLVVVAGPASRRGGITREPGEHDATSEVGDQALATGCHLHFEVHPHGGSIYQDDVNPTLWLHAHVGRSLGGSSGPGFVLATFNTLGASHTIAHGNKPRMGSGVRRTHGLVRLLGRHHVDVAGLQEFQRPQYRTFIRLAGSTYAIYSPRGDTENSVIWRRDTWQLVSANSFRIPYFDGHPRRMPIVRLRARASGRQATFVNVHNPADTRRFPHQAHWRAVALAREVIRVRRLTGSATGPVFVTGDMNDHRRAFCTFTDRAGLLSATGRSRNPRCRPPANAAIDWIFGSSQEGFHGYSVDRDSLVRRTTDHPLVLAHVKGT